MAVIAVKRIRAVYVKRILVRIMPMSKFRYNIVAMVVGIDMGAAKVLGLCMVLVRGHMTAPGAAKVLGLCMVLVKGQMTTPSSQDKRLK